MANINKIRLSGQTYNIEDSNATKTVELTQAQYDALTVKDPNVFYIITDAQGADLSNYYTKSETSGATEISTALASKADAATTYSKTEVDTALASKQTTLTAGTNITIVDNVISATGGGGGGKAISGGTNISITTGETADTINCTLPISASSATVFICGYNFVGQNKINGHNIFIGSSISGSGLSDYNTIISNGTTSSNDVNVYSNGYNLIIGNKNIAKGYARIIGDNNEIEFDSFGIGEGLKSNTKSVNIGYYNNPSSASTTFGDSGNTLFSVGNGTSSSARHNAFEIRQNGDIYITSGGTDIKLQDNLGGGGTVDQTVVSGSTNAVAGGAVYTQLDGLKLKKITQSAYNALSPNYDANTLYIING